MVNGKYGAGRQEEDLLIVFARALQVGKVKTRLIPALGANGALLAYRQLLAATLEAAQGFPGDVELWIDQPDVNLAARARRAGWICRVQQGRDLGERMARAIYSGLQRYQRVLLVGSDCLLLDREYFQQALTALNDADVVLGASEDGGYVLLGSDQPLLWKRNPLTAVRWGGEHALGDTVAALGRYSHRLTTLPALWDVDEPVDLARAVQLGLLPD